MWYVFYGRSPSCFSGQAIIEEADDMVCRSIVSCCRKDTPLVSSSWGSHPRKAPGREPASHLLAVALSPGRCIENPPQSWALYWHGISRVPIKEQGRLVERKDFAVGACVESQGDVLMSPPDEHGVLALREGPGVRQPPYVIPKCRQRRDGPRVRNWAFWCTRNLKPES